MKKRLLSLIDEAKADWFMGFLLIANSLGVLTLVVLSIIKPDLKGILFKLLLLLGLYINWRFYYNSKKIRRDFYNEKNSK